MGSPSNGGTCKSAAFRRDAVSMCRCVATVTSRLGRVQPCRTDAIRQLGAISGTGPTPGAVQANAAVAAGEFRGEREAESGKRKAESGKRKAESGKRKAESGKRKTENGKPKAESVCAQQWNERNSRATEARLLHWRALLPVVRVPSQGVF
jgi:hypothetical protein